MNKLFLTFIVTACVLLAVPLAYSQLPSAAIKATVDSNFFVGSVQLPAGEYTFTFDTSRRHMHIKNVNTGDTLTVFVMDNVDKSAPTANKLVFQNDRGKLVLHRVWSDRAGHVYDVLHGTEVNEFQ